MLFRYFSTKILSWAGEFFEDLKGQEKGYLLLLKLSYGGCFGMVGHWNSYDKTLCLECNLKNWLVLLSSELS